MILLKVLDSNWRNHLFPTETLKTLPEKIAKRNTIECSLIELSTVFSAKPFWCISSSHTLLEIIGCSRFRLTMKLAKLDGVSGFLVWAQLKEIVPTKQNKLNWAKMRSKNCEIRKYNKSTLILKTRKFNQNKQIQLQKWQIHITLIDNQAGPATRRVLRPSRERPINTSTQVRYQFSWREIQQWS